MGHRTRAPPRVIAPSCCWYGWRHKPRWVCTFELLRRMTPRSCHLIPAPAVQTSAPAHALHHELLSHGRDGGHERPLPRALPHALSSYHPEGGHHFQCMLSPWWSVRPCAPRAPVIRLGRSEHNSARGIEVCEEGGVSEIRAPTARPPGEREQERERERGDDRYDKRARRSGLG